MKKQITFNTQEEINADESFKYNGEIRFTADGSSYVGDLVIPIHARTIVVFSHGIGSSRHSVRNHKVAHYLNKKNIATLLVSLEKVDDSLYRHGLSIDYLVDHLRAITRWVHHNMLTHHLAIGYFGASTGAAVALAAAAHEKGTVGAVVCRGGRPDLAMEDLEKVGMPVLLIVGSEDKEGVAINELALEHLKTLKEIKVVNGATHLFEERGKLKIVADLAAEWFHSHLLVEHERALESLRAI